MPQHTFVNARVFTGTGEDDFAEAFASRDGVITWVGDTAEVRDRNAVDLGGRTVLPAFLDVHAHPPGVAMTVRAVPCIAPTVTTIPEMIAALKRHANAGRGPDAWIEGWGYDESKLVEHRTPTAAELDEVSTTQPVFVTRSDVHSAVCNTMALQMAGITRGTPDPEGGRIGRGHDGEPNGLLLELGAVALVNRGKSAESFAARVSAIRSTSDHFVERGIVAVADMMARSRPFDDLAVYRTAAEQGFLPDALLYFSWADMDAPPPDLTDDQRRGRIKFAGIKMFADGSVSGRTAWLREPYAGSGECGMSTLSLEAMQAGYEWAVRNRVQVAVHAMGDRALDRAIAFFADKTPWMGSQVPSVRLEHATLLGDDHIARIRSARMRFGIATQIIFSFAEYDSYVRHLDPEQFARAYRLRTWYDAVECLGLSSDAPATPWADPDNVFVSIEAAVTRTAVDGRRFVPEQALTVAQAILLYTSRPARLGAWDGRLGRIAPGFDASFIVLDRDIFSIPPSRIHDTTVVETWRRGERVFQR